MTRLCIHCHHFREGAPTRQSDGFYSPSIESGLCAHPDAPHSLVSGQPNGWASDERDDPVKCGKAAHRFEERPR